MFGYKCDRCGAPVNVDPGEERICGRCEAEREKNRQEAVQAVYQPEKQEACHAG